MDIGAYAQIEDLSYIAKENNINISRVRGYRLMKNEYEPIIINNEDLYFLEKSCVEELIFGIPKFAINPVAISYYISSKNNKLSKYYDIKNNEIKWNKIHGKFRRHLKYKLKSEFKRIRNARDTFNKYIKRDDVLYIHAKLGTANWSDIDHTYYKNEPWYLDSVDDMWDSVYCDIYAKIDPTTKKENNKVSNNENNGN